MNDMFIGLGLAVSLEWIATLWVGKRRWFWAVVLVNALTFPVFFALAKILVETAYGVPVAEVVIALVEGTVFCLLYGFRCWMRMYAASFVMNAFSYGVSLLFLALLRSSL